MIFLPKFRYFVFLVIFVLKQNNNNKIVLYIICRDPDIHCPLNRADLQKWRSRAKTFIWKHKRNICLFNDVLFYYKKMYNLFLNDHNTISNKNNFYKCKIFIYHNLDVFIIFLIHVNYNNYQIIQINPKYCIIHYMHIEFLQISIYIISSWQICYGIIYGMSAKSLAHQLKTSENEAADFMETFKKSYPGNNRKT